MFWKQSKTTTVQIFQTVKKWKKFCTPAEEIGNKFLNENWEYLDVTARCYVLGMAISEVLDELEDELKFSEDEE